MSTAVYNYEIRLMERGGGRVSVFWRKIIGHSMYSRCIIEHIWSVLMKDHSLYSLLRIIQDWDLTLWD